VFRGQTVRLLIANAATLQRRKPVIDRYMAAYRETIEAMYAPDDSALRVYATWLNIPEATARRTRDQFFPKDAINPDRIVGLDTIVNDAVELKFTDRPLTRAQLDELIQIPPRTR
jgi:NitT/TauT family transport system substrate-binding protein